MIEQHDQGDHGADAPENCSRVSAARCGLQERAQARQAEVPIAEHKHFAGHEGKPASGDGDHGIPNQPDGGKRQVQFREALPAAEAINDGGFAKIARNGFQGRIKTECDVPSLAGENQQDGAKLDAKLAVRKKGDHRKHDGGKKTEDRNGLQDIQQRDQNHFGAA